MTGLAGQLQRNPMAMSLVGSPALEKIVIDSYPLLRCFRQNLFSHWTEI